MIHRDTYSVSFNDLLRVTRGQLQGTFRSLPGIDLQIALLQINGFFHEFLRIKNQQLLWPL